MRKQYQWVALILFITVFFCANQYNDLKACDNNATACSVIKAKIVNTVKHVKKTEVEYGTEENNSVYLLADPFIHSN